LSILTGNVPATPTRIAVLHRFLRGYAADGISEEELVERLQPSVLRAPDSESDGEDGVGDAASAQVATAVLQVALQLGIAVRHTNVIRLAETVIGSDERDLRRFALEALLADVQRPFGLELAWFLQYSPHNAVVFAKAAKGRPGDKALRDSQSPFELDVGARFDNFMRWSRWLGFSWPLLIGKTLINVPDPTSAMLLYLDRVFEKSKRLAAPEFRQHVARLIPALDDGRWPELLTDADRAMGPQVGEFSAAMTLACLRLERRGLLQMELGADAPGGSLTLHGTARSVAFVRWLPR
jgi:hypothetical protein